MQWRRSMPSNLGSHVGGRDNNFNLIRFVAASAVLFSHSFALSVGKSSAEPLHSWLGTTFGQIAVDVFFLTSGFLVTASLLARGSVKTFAMARCLRIYPGLLVAVLLTTAVVGWRFTSLTPQEFFTSADTWRYVLKNATMVTGEMHTLPGAFEHTPWRHLVNSSLWTLPYELAMYGLLSVFWIVLSMTGAEARLKWVVAGIAVLTMGAQLIAIDWLHSSALRLTAIFFVGSSLYAFRGVVPMNTRLFFVLGIAMLVSMAQVRLFGIVYLLTLPYLVLFLAYIPRGFIRKFNDVGDCSYGLYIYAWPIQQMLAALLPGIQPLPLFALSFVTTTTLACASWKLVEKPALSLKHRAARIPSLA